MMVSWVDLRMVMGRAILWIFWRLAPDLGLDHPSHLHVKPLQPVHCVTSIKHERMQKQTPTAVCVELSACHTEEVRELHFVNICSAMCALGRFLRCLVYASLPLRDTSSCCWRFASQRTHISRTRLSLSMNGLDTLARTRLSSWDQVLGSIVQIPLDLRRERMERKIQEQLGDDLQVHAPICLCPLVKVRVPSPLRAPHDPVRPSFF